MASARALQIDIESTPYYHVMARCVRRSYLCGVDPLTQKDYSHRKNWMVSRIKLLTQIFSIKVCAYAIMSNHYHLVLFVDEEISQKWSDADIIARWHSIFPKDANKNAHIPDKISLWRERLTSISWFMRCLNEPIARASNDEDDCTGRFWEGRFKSQALLDDGALLSAMAYVDLNPIRAGLAQTPEESEYTSIYERIQFMSKEIQLKSKVTPNQSIESYDTLNQPKSLLPFSNTILGSKKQEPKINFTLSDYIELVEYTGKVVREDKIGSIPENLPPLLNRLNFDITGWLAILKNFRHKFYSAIGNEVCLINFSRNRRRTAKGLRAAQEVYLT